MAVTRKDLLRSDYPGTFLLCPDCGDEYSATYGDYFFMPDDQVFLCGDCDRGMILAERITTINIIKE